MTEPTKPIDELQLCKGCGTMKHVNADGYCGRCRPIDDELKKLRVYRAASIYGKNTYTAETLVRFQKNWLDDLRKLITADRKQLLDRVEKNIIGADETDQTTEGEKINKREYLIWLMERNALRAEQRTKFAKLRKEYLGDE